MAKNETIYAVSDPQPTVEQAVAELAARLDKYLKDMVAVFQEAGQQLWNAEPASHAVTPVMVPERRPTGILGHENVQVTRYVASAIMMVSFQEHIK